MLTSWMAYILAATTASVLFVAAGWRSRRVAGSGFNRLNRLPDMSMMASGHSGGRAQPLGDAAEAIHMALKRLTPLIESQAVHVDVAARLGLLVRLRAPALIELLEDLITIAIHNAPASVLLLTAAAHGNHIHINVSDDLPGADLSKRQSQTRGVQERIAMLGGVLDIDVRPAEGTVMTLRLAAAFETPEEEAGAAQPQEAARQLL
jgi:hypothetical protein